MQLPSNLLAPSLFTLALLTSCAPVEPQPVNLVLVPPAALDDEIDAELAIEGLSALLVARLRAMPEVSVQINLAGCGRAATATHELRIVRELTTSSSITTLLLRACGQSGTEVEHLVQPRQQRRDWSAEAAWWVGARLDAPPAQPVHTGAVDEAQMQRFLIALARLKRRTAEDVGSAAAELSELSRSSPQFAQAHAYRAAAQMLAFEYGLVELEQALQEADAAIIDALRLAPDLGMAHAARGLYFMNQERYAEAAPQLARAAALDPGDATILLWMGNALLYHGRPRDAVPWLERAHALDPTLISVQISLGEAACLGGMEDICSRFLRNPGSGPMARFMAGLLLAHQGQFEAAQARIADVAAGVNAEWVSSLRADLCPFLGAADCQPRWIRPAGNAEPLLTAPGLDFWRIDLGLSGWVKAARTDDDARDRLTVELARLRSGGLSLPVLDLIESCLQGAPVARELQTDWAPLLQAWGCPEITVNGG